MVCPWMDKGNLSNYLSGDGESLGVEGRYKIVSSIDLSHFLFVDARLGAASSLLWASLL